MTMVFGIVFYLSRFAVVWRFRLQQKIENR
jgi:hypothetical protein